MRRAFTIIEFIVCLAIISIIFALLYPAVMSAREAAQKRDQKIQSLPDFKPKDHVIHIQTKRTALVIESYFLGDKALISYDDNGQIEDVYKILLLKQVER